MTDAFCAIRELMFLLKKRQAGEYWIVKCVLQVILLSLKKYFFLWICGKCGKSGGADIQVLAER